jgi:hypothetical protein
MPVMGFEACVGLIVKDDVEVRVQVLTVWANDAVVDIDPLTRMMVFCGIRAVELSVNSILP